MTSGDALRLPENLARTSRVSCACEVVVDALLDAGLTLPSIYLERGGRLRCLAVHGYWQIFDGIPLDAGVIGATFRSGRPTELRGVTGSPDYLAVAPAVVDEICVPLRCAGRVVGVVNVESTTGLPEGALAVLTEAARLLGERLAELGGVPPESAAQRLSRHTALIAAADGQEELSEAACRAAREVTGSSSAAMVLRGPDGDLAVLRVDGPVLQPLLDPVLASPALLEQVAGWVSSGSSCCTIDEPDGAGLPGSVQLRAAGAATVLVVPLGPAAPAGRPGGFLLVADERPVDLSTEVVERLEVVGALVTSGVRTLTSLTALRAQASRDPLTGLGHHAAYHAALDAALGHGATGRTVAVLLVDLDDFKAVNDHDGHQAGDAQLRAAARVLSGALREQDQLYRIGGDEFAAVLAVHSAGEALAVGERLVAAARAELAVSISVGIAMAAHGEQTVAVLERADRALYAVKRAGRDGARLSA